MKYLFYKDFIKRKRQRKALLVTTLPLILAIISNVIMWAVLFFVIKTNISLLLLTMPLQPKTNTNATKFYAKLALTELIPFSKIKTKIAPCSKYRFKLNDTTKNIRFDTKLNFIKNNAARNRILLDYVKYVIDGDTIITKCNYKVRLALIDAPELIHRQQPFAISAKQLTEKLILHKPAILVIPKMKYPYDNYHRLIALVFTTSGINVNNELVKQGLALYNPFQVKDAFNYVLEQNQGKAQKLKNGIWQIQ